MSFKKIAMIQNINLAMICAGVLVFSNTSFAKNPFGDQVSGKSLILGVDECYATKLLDKAITETGVNFLDRDSGSVWTCQCDERNGSGKCDGGTVDTRVMLNGCKAGDEIRCYSDSPAKSPAICLKKPRAVKLKKYYADAGNVDESRARFDAIYIVRKDGAGYSHSATKFWKMDDSGCNPVSAFIGNPMGSYDECKKYIMAYINGGYMWSTDISKDKFCSGKADQDMLNAIDKLHDCKEAYPQLGRDITQVFYERRTGTKASKKAPAN